MLTAFPSTNYCPAFYIDYVKRNIPCGGPAGPGGTHSERERRSLVLDCQKEMTEVGHGADKMSVRVLCVCALVRA